MAAVGDDASELLILHELAPCVTFLRFAPAAPKGLELVKMTCMDSGLAANIADFTGASLTGHLHISGHLVEFPRPLALLDARRRGLPEDSVREKEWFVMAHTRHADGDQDRDVYSHWCADIRDKTLLVTRSDVYCH